jgi:TolB-like protein
MQVNVGLRQSSRRNDRRSTVSSCRTLISTAAILALSLGVAHAERKAVVAMNPLSSSGGLAADHAVVSDIMRAELSASETVTLVDRKQMDLALRELSLGQQGMLAPESARQLGRIVGCSYFCSGYLRKSGDKVMATVKVIDIETTLTKLAYTFLKTPDDAVEAGKTLAGKVEEVIALFESEKAARKAAQPPKPIAKMIPAEWTRPTVMVIIRETHVRQPTLIDPAGETEVIKRLLAADFTVVDSEYVQLMKRDQAVAKKRFGSLKTSTQYAEKKGVDILLYGEAISERAASLGDFEGCRARIELKAVDVETDRILLSDSAEGGATDLAETVAGKKAIQQAANRLADTFLYSLAKTWSDTHQAP